MDWFYEDKKRNQAREYSITFCTYCSLIFLSIFLFGCTSTRNADFEPIDALVAEKSYVEASQEIESNRERLYKEQDSIIYFVESGTVSFYAGDYDKAIEQLHAAEELIERFYGVSAQERFVGYLRNESELMYESMRYEEIFVSILLILSYLMKNDLDGSLVEVRRLDIKLRTLEDRFYDRIDTIHSQEEQYVSIDVDAYSPYDSPFARFLSSLVYLSDARMDDARIDYEAFLVAHGAQQGTDALPSDLVDLSSSVDHSVVVFAGTTPIKRQLSVLVVGDSNGVRFLVDDTSDLDLVRGIVTADAILAKQLGPAWSFHFAVPVLETRNTAVAYIKFFINGVEQYSPALLDDVSQEFENEYEAEFPFIFARAFISAILKSITSSVVSSVANSMEESESDYSSLAKLGSLALDIGIASNAIADIRISRYFPGKVFAGKYVLENPTNSVRVEYYDEAMNLLYSEQREISKDEVVSLFIDIK